MSELPLDREMSEKIAETLAKVFNDPWPVGMTNNGLQTPMRQQGNTLSFTTIRGRTVEVEVRALALREEMDPLYLLGDDEL